MKHKKTGISGWTAVAVLAATLVGCQPDPVAVRSPGAPARRPIPDGYPAASRYLPAPGSATELPADSSQPRLQVSLVGPEHAEVRVGSPVELQCCLTNSGPTEYRFHLLGFHSNMTNVHECFVLRRDDHRLYSTRSLSVGARSLQPGESLVLAARLDGLPLLKMETEVFTYGRPTVFVDGTGQIAEPAGTFGSDPGSYSVQWVFYDWSIDWPAPILARSNTIKVELKPQ